MNSPHIIRLRGPWLRKVVEGAVGLPPLRTAMPNSWEGDLGADFQGSVAYQRNFNRPTGIDATTSVRLVFQQVVGRARVTLNGEELGLITRPDARGFVVTDKLAAHNRLEVQISSPDEKELAAAKRNYGKGPGLVGEVQLEID